MRPKAAFTNQQSCAGWKKFTPKSSTAFVQSWKRQGGLSPTEIEICVGMATEDFAREDVRRHLNDRIARKFEQRQRLNSRPSKGGVEQKVPRPKRNRETEAMRRMIHQHLHDARAGRTADACRRASGRGRPLCFRRRSSLARPESAPVVTASGRLRFLSPAQPNSVRLETETERRDDQRTSCRTEEPGRIRRCLKTWPRASCPHG